MFRNMKLAVRTSLFMVLVLVVGFISLWKSVERASSNLVSNIITNQMTDAVRTRAAIIDDYVKSAEEYMVAFSLSSEVKNILLDPDSVENQKVAQQYTVEFAQAKGIFEGLYIADYNTMILAHSNVPGAIGTYNKKDKATQEAFQEKTLSTQTLKNSGILKSPSSGEMVIAMYYPVYDQGKCIGFVGAGVYAKNLMDSLLSLKVEGLPNSEYVFLNVNTGEYLYHSDPSLLCTETTDIGYLAILDTIRQNSKMDVGSYIYTDSGKDEKIVIYRNFPERGWVFALRDSTANVYSSIQEVRQITGSMCLITGVVIIVILVIILSSIGRQLNLIRASISQLGDMDLNASDQLAKYRGYKDEVGIICDAITKTCDNLNLYIGAVDEQLASMAQGDYTKKLDVEFAGKFKNLEQSMRYIQAELRKSFKQINTVTSELVIGSNQVSDSASQLANAAVDANQLVVDINSRVDEITNSVSASAEAANLAKQEMNNTAELVSVSQKKMEELSIALEKIANSTTAINEVSNNMEQIAKQTNILSLNALVEATRAGEVGRGFGVVANEIRMLAQQSNESATNAFQLIHDTLACVEEGLRIGEETSEHLRKVADQTKHIDVSITSIADVTKMQNENLTEVRNNLHVISSNIETTAGMAEQSAAASTELDGQINVLEENISKYKV